MNLNTEINASKAVRFQRSLELLITKGSYEEYFDGDFFTSSDEQYAVVVGGLGELALSEYTLGFNFGMASELHSGIHPKVKYVQGGEIKEVILTVDGQAKPNFKIIPVQRLGKVASV